MKCNREFIGYGDDSGGGGGEVALLFDSALCGWWLDGMCVLMAEMGCTRDAIALMSLSRGMVPPEGRDHGNGSASWLVLDSLGGFLDITSLSISIVVLLRVCFR